MSLIFICFPNATSCNSSYKASLKQIFSPRKKFFLFWPDIASFSLSTDTFKKQLYTYIFIHTIYTQLFVLKINFLLMGRSMDTQQQTTDQSANKVKGLQLALNNPAHRKAQGYYVFPQHSILPFVFRSLLELACTLSGARKI